MGELSDKCQTMMGANLSALLLHRCSTEFDGELVGGLRGPKAAFLGAAIDAPRKNIDVFVDEAWIWWMEENHGFFRWQLAMIGTSDLNLDMK